MAAHILSLAKDMKLDFYTDPTGYQTLDHRVAVHYTTAVLHQLVICHFNIEWTEVGVMHEKGYVYSIWST